MLDRAEPPQIPELVDVDMPVIDLIAALPQQIAHHILTRAFGAPGGGDRDEITGDGKLGVETGIDRIEDFSLGIGGVHGVTGPIVAFRIASVPIHSRKSREPWSHGCLATAIFCFSLSER